MNLLPFGKLLPHKPRKFVPERIDLGDWSQIAPLFEQLEIHAAQCKSVADLERWANSKRNKAKALNDYKKALTLGGSRPLPELFQAAGCKFEFNGTMMKPLIELARNELKKF